MSNIVIDPSSGILEFNTGSANGSSFDNSLLGASRLEFQNSGQIALTSLSTGVSEKFTVDGPNGRLFTVDNEVTGSIFSINDAAGLPIVEVFSDDRIIMGQYATDALVISGSSVQVTGSNVVTEGHLSDENYVTSDEILTHLLTVDGANSNLDADKLDGQQGSYYLDYGNFSNTPTVNDVSETNLLNRLAALDSSDTIYIGDAGDDTTVVVRGTLQVDGATTTINSNTLSIGDNQIVLNNDVTGTPTQNAGIIVERGTSTNASLIWDEANDYWKAGLAGSEVQLALTNGTYSGLRAQATTKTDVGLSNVTNESKATMFTSPSFTGDVVITDDTFPFIRSVTNGAGAGIRFSDQTGYGQQGTLKFVHSDGASYGSGASFILATSEATSTILADGKLMYGEGIYSKPASGTGAGTRKDSNWDTAYTHTSATNNPHSVTASQVGLGNVTNESKATMFSSPSFTGTPIAPTAAAGTDSTQIATTAFVDSYFVSNRLDTPVQIYNPWGVNKFYDGVATNRFHGRSELLSLSVDGGSTSAPSANLTDGGYESAAGVYGTAGGSDVVLLYDFEPNGLTGSNGFTYASGQFHIHFYPGRHPTAITARVKNRYDTWTSMTMTGYREYTSGNYISWRGTCPIGNYVTAVEFTLTPQGTGGNTINLTELEYHGTRMGLSEGGLLTKNGGDIFGDLSFNDSYKAKFGTGNDLQIYHDGSNSYIDDTGTGDLYIRANNLRLSNADGSGQTINTNNGGNVELFFNNSKKFETTSSGITVTGSIVKSGGSSSEFLKADGSVDSSTYVSSSALSSYLPLAGGTLTGDLVISTTAFTNLDLKTSRTGATDNIGGVQFYKSSTLKGQIFGVNDGKVKIATGGTTVAMTLDENQNVGIGTTSPDQKLQVIGDVSVGKYDGTDFDRRIGINSSNGGYANGSSYIRFQELSASGTTNTTKGCNIRFYNHLYAGNTNETLVIQANGNVGIGVTSPDSKLHVASGNVLISNNQFYTAESTLGTNYKLAGLTSGNVIQIGAIDYTSASTVFAGGDNLSLTTGGASGTTRLYINSSGEVGIGTTSPSYKLDVNGSFNSTSLHLNGINQHASTRYTLPSNNVSFTRTAASNGSDQWFKIYSGGGSTTLIRLSITSGGDNTQSRDEFLISVAGYGFKHHIQRLPAGRYNGSKLLAIATTNPSAGGTVEIWVKLYGMVSGSASTNIFANAGLESSSNILSSATGTAPTITSNGTQLDISVTNRNETTIMASRGATFGSKVGIGTDSPATILDLDDGTLSDIRIRGNATTDVRFAGIAFYNTAGSDTVAAVNVDRDGANDAGALTFDTQPAGGGNTERMRITSAGNVGIGNNNPTAGKLVVRADSGYAFRTENASGFTFRVEASTGNIYTTGDTYIQDGSKIRLGDNNDLQIYHAGGTTGSYIDNYVGHMRFNNYGDDTDIIFQNDNGSGGITEYFRLDGGAAITVFSKEARFTDNVKLKLGSGPDFEMYHDGTQSYIHNDTGDLIIQNDANDKDIIFKSDDGSGGIAQYLRLDGTLGYTVANKHILLNDDVKLRVGSNADLEIYHDGSDSYIRDLGTGELRISGSKTRIYDADLSSLQAEFTDGGSVDLYYDSNKKFETTSTGVNVTGTITASGGGAAPSAPASASATIVGETVEVTFTASTTSNIDAYLVYSSIDGSDYGLISVVPPDDFAASMSIIDNAFDETGTQAYRVYATKLGKLSSATTASVSYAVSSAEPTTMSVINLNNAYYVQWNPPSSNVRFVTAYNVYKHEHATQGSLSRSSASLVYSGMNTNYMYQISGTNNNNFHQFWVETTIA